MVNSQKIIGLVWRPPSLKGHSVEKRLHGQNGMRVYLAMNRHTLLRSKLYLPIASRTSIAGVINLLEQAEVDFQALMLRNGDLCCLAEVGPELNKTNSGEASEGNHHRATWRLAAVLLALGVCLLGFLLWSPQLSQPAPDASALDLSVVPTLDCSALLDSVNEDLQAFLEEGRASTNYVFETLASLQNGGLRSVEVEVTCPSNIEGSGDRESSQKWRATLKKSDLSWVVTKMTRLEN